jgi:lipoprotein-anchoring transpeptidase ErfK/SrfK
MEPSPNSPPASGRAATAGGPDTAARPVPATPPAPSGGPTRRVRSSLLWRAAAIGAGLLLAVLLVAGTGYRYEPYAEQPLAVSSDIPSDARPLQQLTTRLRARQRDLAARFDAIAPKGVYIVIDQTQNRIYLKRRDETLLEGTCSAGSGMVLRESGGKQREWVFDSPRGRFEVLSMSRNPVWRKPDWAFVEESQPIPKNPADRLDYGSLGEYALYFGNGFMIHGTLYERLLGRAVSHGCIRVGRDDLRKVWANSHLGTQIFIY